MENGIIEMNMGACIDRLGQEILNIKRRFLIDPAFLYSRDKGCDLDAHVPQLAYALFSSACLTCNFKRDWNSLFQSLAVGVVLS